MFIIEIFSSKDENWKNYLAIPGYYSSIANDYPVSLVERRYLLLIVKARTLQSVYTLPIFLTRRGERTYKGRSDGLITSEQLIFECDSVV